MNPVVRAIGKVLRLVGISSPEDSVSKPKGPVGAPSWRNASEPKPDDDDDDKDSLKRRS
jgi:hypothetical protein